MPTDDSVTNILLEELRALRLTVDNRMSELNTKVSSMDAQIAELRSTNSQQEREMVAFWAQNWGPLAADIQDIKNRLTSLESKDVIELERRIDALESEKAVLQQRVSRTDEEKLGERLAAVEKREAKRLGLAAGAGLASGGVARILEWLLGGSGG